jgi:putative hydrolase of the HAD superfamily
LQGADRADATFLPETKIQQRKDHQHEQAAPRAPGDGQVRSSRERQHERRQIEGFSRTIAEQEIVLLPGVAETLVELASRHHLILMTKGNHAEQAGKFARSGLASHFSAVEIVPEKDHAAYRNVVERHRLAPQSTWMIGNSPKSDINPALAAGLNAVFLVHTSTWVLEHEAVDPTPAGRHLLQIASFAELGNFF